MILTRSLDFMSFLSSPFFLPFLFQVRDRKIPSFALFCVLLGWGSVVPHILLFFSFFFQHSFPSVSALFLTPPSRLSFFFLFFLRKYITRVLSHVALFFVSHAIVSIKKMWFMDMCIWFFCGGWNTLIENLENTWLKTLENTCLKIKKTRIENLEKMKNLENTVKTLYGQEGGGQFFSILCGRLLWTTPYEIICCKKCPLDKNITSKWLYTEDRLVFAFQDRQKSEEHNCQSSTIIQ